MDHWVGLAYKIYGGVGLVSVFDIKMLGTTVLLAVVVFINYYTLAMAKKGQVPDAASINVVPIPVRGSFALILFGISITATVPDAMIIASVVLRYQINISKVALHKYFMALGPFSNMKRFSSKKKFFVLYY